MKILILHQHFKIPQRGGAIRSYYLAKALVGKGHEVIVLTGHNEAYRDEIIDDIRICWLPVAYDNRFGFTARSFSFLSYVVQVLRRSNLYRDAAICYAISVPLTTGLASLWIKRRYKIPFIFEVGDLWPDAPVQMGFIKNRMFKRLLYNLEQKIYRQAESVVALSVSIKKAIEEKMPGKTVHLIPNMADTCFYKPSAKDPLLEDKFGVKTKFVISYIGAIGVANGLDYVVNCAKAAATAELPVHFLLCGDGAMLTKLKEQKQQYLLSNLSFIPFQNRDGVLDVMNVTDAIFVSYAPVPILETGSPNKYFDGLSAGKLILINFGGWIKDEIEKYQCGIYLSPEDPLSFVQKIKLFLADRSLVQRYQQSARSLAEQCYARKDLGKKYVDVVLGEVGK